MKNTELIKCPEVREQCACYKNGDCTLLEKTDFGDKGCPFYKTANQANQEWLESIFRLIALGKYQEAARCLQRGWDNE